MADLSGISGELPTQGPTPGQGIQGVSGGANPASPNLLQTPVHTLGDLKALLISSLGEEDGTKFYNNILKSFASSMISQVQSFTKHEHEISKQMQNPG